ncbi:hypothetical protein EIN_430620 [Entamoeba invadens IP1]|uniref:Ras family protein n=1 Tax=Entamoeba invadens IP1 TaxID=370355 RepID=A0A0A1UF71_ENTIV|nr:hypothetical protein EIN_430620 [Entamoeba invadens IP1]ELP95256.1 hypothetical protein EIN_430620 [Entamoeba invadens IP1]|eukprot:XP_004262027.1 hypothetical protein EIN_430620 [Entamoeba invadens IP1]
MSKETAQQNSVGVVLIGLPKTGKTALACQFCDQPAPTEYNATTIDTPMDTTLTIGKAMYNFTFNDCSGSALLNSRTTANTILSKGKIHIFVVSPTESDSAEYIQGFFKDLTKDSEPIYRFVFVTHKEQEDKDGVVASLKDFIPDDCKIYQYDVLNQKDEIVNNFTDFMKRALVEHKELFEGCLATEKPKKAQPADSAKQGDAPKKKKACLIF